MFPLQACGKALPPPPTTGFTFSCGLSPWHYFLKIKAECKTTSIIWQTGLFKQIVFNFLCMLYIVLEQEGQWEAFPWEVRPISLGTYPERGTDGLVACKAWKNCLCFSLAIEQLSRVLWFIQNLLSSDFWWAVHCEAIPACFIGPYMLLLQGRNIVKLTRNPLHQGDHQEAESISHTWVVCFRPHWQEDKVYEWGVQISPGSSSIDLDLTDQQWTAASIPSLNLGVPNSVAVFIETVFLETYSTLKK